MSKTFLRLPVLMAAVIAVSMPAYAQMKTSVQDIKKSLMCQCGCQMTVEACGGSMNCTFADNLTLEINKFVQNGENKNQIVARFVSRYGETVLAAPTKKGFNLVAWILPFAAIGIAGIIIVKLLQNWVRSDRRYFMKAKKDVRKKADIKYEKKLDTILRSLE